MQLSDIKKSLFGYKRDDVYKYFSDLSNDFSERLKKTEESSERQIDELSRRNADLEARVADLTRQNEEYRAKEIAVADSIIGAKRYADELRADTDRIVAAQREELKGEYTTAKQRAEAMLASVGVCKDAIARQLERILSELTEAEGSVAAEIDTAEKDIMVLEESAGSETPSLFHLRKE